MPLIIILHSRSGIRVIVQMTVLFRDYPHLFQGFRIFASEELQLLAAENNFVPESPAGRGRKLNARDNGLSVRSRTQRPRRYVHDPYYREESEHRKLGRTKAHRRDLLYIRLSADLRLMPRTRRGEADVLKVKSINNTKEYSVPNLTVVLYINVISCMRSQVVWGGAPHHGCLVVRGCQGNSTVSGHDHGPPSNLRVDKSRFSYRLSSS